MNQSVETKIELISKDMSYVKQFIESDRVKYNEHLVSAQDYRDKVNSLFVSYESLNRLFQEHCNQDRILFIMLFGLNGSTLLGVLYKIFWVGAK